MSIPLLATKLYIPPLQPGSVPRRRLLGRLEAGLRRKLTLVYTLSVVGIVIWLVLVLVLAAIASSPPARNAVRLTVRDVLAYE